MARFGRSRSRASRSSNGGGSTYSRPTTENISVIRLYQHDNTDYSFSAPTIANIGEALGIAKAFNFRIIAVGFEAKGDSAISLEWHATGNTSTLSKNALKPTRVRVPAKDYIDGQWFNVKADGTYNPAPLGDINPATYVPFGVVDQSNNIVVGAVQFIDVAVRY